MKVPIDPNNPDGATRQTKECNGCTACCFACSINELKKQAYQRCKYQTPSGCGIHNSRPNECRKYGCLWLLVDDMPEDMRPDRSRVVLDIGVSELGPTLYARELDPRSSEKPKVRQLIDQMAVKSKLVVCVISGDNKARRLRVPQGMEEVRDKLKALQRSHGGMIKTLVKGVDPSTSTTSAKP